MTPEAYNFNKSITYMKKFTMLGVPLLVFLAIMTQASFSAETNKKAGGETAKILATVEGSTFQIDCCNLNANFIAGEKMNMTTTTLVDSDSKKEEAKEVKDAEIMATMEVSTLQSDHMVANDVIWENTAATEIKTGYAMEVAGILPDETVLVSNSNKKYEIQNSNNCNCATCMSMARNTLVNMGGNSA